MKKPEFLKICVSALSLFLVAGPASAVEKGFPTLGKIERLDPAINDLLSPDARIEKLAEGFSWSEGPVWSLKDNCILFSDVKENVVHSWQEGKGIGDYLRPSGYNSKIPRGGEMGSNGLTFDSKGRLVLCEHGDRRVARLEDRSRNVQKALVDHFDNKRFNSPNDLTFNSKGDLYFTDPPYGLEGMNNDPKKEIPFSGVYRLDKKGKLTLLINDLPFPNGIAFSPDEKTLYVSVSDPKKAIWMAYDVKPDGTPTKGRIFFDATSLTEGRKGLPDGIKIDKDGNMFSAGPGGILIFTPDGKHLGTINTGEPTGNCAWGEDGGTLYITANHYLCRIRTKTKGNIPGVK